MKSDWSDFIHYTEIMILSKTVILLYILKIFFINFPLENILRILNNSIYFQNIFVCNEPLNLSLFKKRSRRWCFPDSYLKFLTKTFLKSIPIRKKNSYKKHESDISQIQLRNILSNFT